MRFWQYVNILSIDVSLGAVVGCAFFARILGISLLPHAMISLGLIVWVIYTVDHLVDAYHSQALPATERHRFHKRHAKQLLMAAIVAGILIAGEVFLVRKPVLFAGMGLGILVIAYLLLQASLKFANLTRADLRKANLFKALLGESNATETDFTRALGRSELRRLAMEGHVPGLVKASW